MNDMKLMVPTKTAVNVGVREVSDGSIANEVFKVLEKPKQAYVHENNWSKRYRANVDKIKSGDIFLIMHEEIGLRVMLILTKILKESGMLKNGSSLHVKIRMDPSMCSQKYF